MPTKRDANHNLIPQIMKYRMGGYFKDANGVHYAHLDGLTVSAYDMAKVGRGLPDWLVCVSWLTVFIEIKNIEGRGVRYTPAEDVFNSSHHVIYRMFTNGDDAYDFLKSIARLVNDLEDLASRELPLSYMQTFFPKVQDGFKLINSEEFKDGNKEMEEQPSTDPSQYDTADNGHTPEVLVSSQDGLARELLIEAARKKHSNHGRTRSRRIRR